MWSEKGKKKFRQELREIETAEVRVEKMWENMKERITRLLERGNKSRKKIGRRGW